MSSSDPKVFISYCWASTEYQARVMELAEALVSHGVDVKIDKWDLKEGHDLNSFMESMVHDETINKVIMLFDKEYTERADKKKGGVGTETQIISQEVYRSVEQNKFVGVVFDRDVEGRSYIPIYYKSRIRIDLTEESTYSEEYERLLRWIYDKPLYKKPELGKKPTFLDDENSTQDYKSNIAFKLALDAVKKNTPNAVGLVNDYFNHVHTSLEGFSVVIEDRNSYDDVIVKRIDELLPVRNQLVEMFSCIASYNSNLELIDTIHRFLEELIKYTVPLERRNGYLEGQFDNYHFLAYELFLYVIAILIKHEKFKEIDFLADKGFYNENIVLYNNDNSLPNFTYFYKHLSSLDYRNGRLGLRRASLTADFIKERSSGMVITHKEIIQADFVLYVRSLVKSVKVEDEYWFWFPINLVYLDNLSRPNFEVFLRSKSAAYFNDFKFALSVESLEDLVSILGDRVNEEIRLSNNPFGRFSVRSLSNIDKLCTA